MTDRDVDDALNIVLLYVPSAAAKQMLGELERSRVAAANENFKKTVTRLGAALAARGPLTYAKP